MKQKRQDDYRQGGQKTLGHLSLSLLYFMNYDLRNDWNPLLPKSKSSALSIIHSSETCRKECSSSTMPFENAKS